MTPDYLRHLLDTGSHALSPEWEPVVDALVRIAENAVCSVFDPDAVYHNPCELCSVCKALAALEALK